MDRKTFLCIEDMEVNLHETVTVSISNCVGKLSGDYILGKVMKPYRCFPDDEYNSGNMENSHFIGMQQNIF